MIADARRNRVEPRGFGEHNRGLSGEYAHEQGWGLDEEERTRLPLDRQHIVGGTDYDYGAHDFGDEPVNTAYKGKTRDEEAERRALGGDTGKKESRS